MTRSPDPAIVATIAGLREILQQAALLALSADAAITAGNRNLAIGTLLPMESMLPTACALFQATLALHRLDREVDTGCPNVFEVLKDAVATEEGNWGDLESEPDWLQAARIVIAAAGGEQ